MSIVTDEMIEAGKAALNGELRDIRFKKTDDLCRAIYLAMKAKEQPLETVERVARAISLARDGFSESPPMPVTDYDRDLARAAIASMGNDGLREALRKIAYTCATLSSDSEETLRANLRTAEALARTSLGTDGGEL